MTARAGVFGILAFRLPAGTRETWLDTRVQLPDDWPREIRTNTEYLPDAHGVLARERVVEAADLAAALERTHSTTDDVVDHEIVAPGSVRLVFRGELPHPTTIEGLLEWMRDRHRAQIAYLSVSALADGRCAIEAYFADYDEFVFAFDTWMYPASRAAALGATGSGAFIWDDECEEPVCFSIMLADGVASVEAIDPQDAPVELLPRWQEACDRIRADYEAWR